MYRSILSRRTFTTTARLLRPSNGKPSPQGHDDPPPPPNDPKPSANEPENQTEKPKEDLQGDKSELRERFLGAIRPRSEHFIFAFANPRLSKEQRTKSGLLLIAATLLALLTEPYFYKAASEPGGSLPTSAEERFLNTVALARAEREKANEDLKTNR